MDLSVARSGVMGSTARGTLCSPECGAWSSLRCGAASVPRIRAWEMRRVRVEGNVRGGIEFSLGSRGSCLGATVRRGRSRKLLDAQALQLFDVAVEQIVDQGFDVLALDDPSCQGSGLEVPQ